MEDGEEEEGEGARGRGLAHDEQSPGCTTRAPPGKTGAALELAHVMAETDEATPGVAAAASSGTSAAQQDADG